MSQNGALKYVNDGSESKAGSYGQQCHTHSRAGEEPYSLRP